MKHAPAVQGVACHVLESIRKDYENLIAASAPLSIQELFNSDQMQLGEFCKEFSPHPQSSELRSISKSFGEQYRIWLPNANDHISCALFLYPTGDFNRMLIMMKNLTLGFYLNDIFGRDLFKFLTREEQYNSRQMIERMANIGDTLLTSSNAHLLELVNASVLREFRDNSPQSWFQTFLKVYRHHISITHMDTNTDALGYIPSVGEYTENRIFYAGVHHIVLWIEFSNGEFLNWDMLKKTNISDSLKRLHWVTAAFGSLANDLFSFEKEVIDNSSDSNLLMIIALNDPNLSLMDVIFRSSNLVCNLLKEFISLIDFIKKEIDRIAGIYPDLAAQLTGHLSGVIRCVQATWLWHVYTKRYKRTLSIWKETTF